MTARRFPFRLELAGMVLVGVVGIEGDGEIEQLREDQVAAPETPHPPIKPEEPAPRGRPSFDTLLDAVCAELGTKLNYRNGITACANQVLHYLAQRCDDAELLPSRRTVEIYLTAARDRGKVRGKSHGNSRRGTRRKGGPHARS
jgi:hypothetical protein